MVIVFPTLKNDCMLFRELKTPSNNTQWLLFSSRKAIKSLILTWFIHQEAMDLHLKPKGLFENNHSDKKLSVESVCESSVTNDTQFSTYCCCSHLREMFCSA